LRGVTAAAAGRSGRRGRRLPGARRERTLNWELQLATAMGYEDEEFLSGAREAREHCRGYRFGTAMGILWSLLLEARRSDSPRRIVFALLHMGKVYENWMYDVAFKFFREALEKARKVDFGPGEMVALDALGRLYRTWREPDRALPCFERCLDLARRFAGPSCQREVVLVLIECHEACGNDRERCALAKELRLLDEVVGSSDWEDASASGPCCWSEE
jgi:hypothetical protein